MGVTGLWQLIESSGKPVPLETLENKVLAVDLSIWLHQVVKGYQDNKGNVLPNAHLLGLFNRLCKLLYYRVKPVFIFDGGVPELKRQTIFKRSQAKKQMHNEANRIQQLIMESLAKEKIVQQALGVAPSNFVSPTKHDKKQQERDELFKLPPIKEENVWNPKQEDEEEEENEKKHKPQFYLDINTIDVKSQYFKSLPADVRLDILTDVKETRKQNSWGKIHEMPVEGNNFSNFQMERLLKRRQVQVSFEETGKEMGGKCFSLAELESLMTEDGIIETSEKHSRQIASDENARIMLVKNITKAISEAKMSNSQEDKEPEASTSKSAVNLDFFNKQKKALGIFSTQKELLEKISQESEEQKEAAQTEDEDEDDEMDEDLQKAIQLSLQPLDPDTGENLGEPSDVKLNSIQKQKFGGAIKKHVRGFIMENAGMNDDDIKDLLEATQSSSQKTKTVISDLLDDYVLYGSPVTTKQREKSPEIGFISDSDDSDLVSSLEQFENSSRSIENTPTKKSDVESNVGEDFFTEIEEFARKKKLAEEAESSKIQEFNRTVKSLSLKKTKPPKITVEIEIPKVPEIEDGNSKDLFSSDTECYDLEDIELMRNSVRESQKSLPEPEKGRLILSPEDSEAETENDERVLKIKRNKTELKSSFLASLQKEAQGKLLNLNEDGETAVKTTNIVELSDESGDEMEKDKETSKLPESDEEMEEIDDERELMNDKEEASDKGECECEEIKSAEKIDLGGEAEKNENEDETMGAETLKVKEPNIKENLEIEENSNDSDSTFGLFQYTVESSEILKDSEKAVEPAKIPEKTEIFREKEASENTDKENLEKAVITILEDAKTPPKKKDITAYIQVTPKKSTEKKTPTHQEEENIPKTPKPFFVNRTPSSSKKKEQVLNNILSDIKEKIRVTKSLFEKDEENRAVNALKESKTEEELRELAGKLASEKRSLEMERNKQDRMGMSITESMNKDCKKLLKLFGIPYLESPMEAEAQAAFLNSVGLTDGTITDDSDIWLFGGQVVYKNVFQQKKIVTEFRMENIEKMYSMSREKLIQLALLTGSDYTVGIQGIGAVTALEILAAFPPTEEKAGETTRNMALLSSLRKFREWFLGGKTPLPGKSVLKSKLKNIELNEGFPSINVVQAYLEPLVDTSTDPFTWGTPDVESIYEFAKNNMGWTRLKTDEILQPVLKRLNEKKQASITDYFKMQASKKEYDRSKMSDRVKKAVERMAGIENGEEEKPKKTRKRAAKKKTEKTKVKEDEEVVILLSEDDEEPEPDKIPIEEGEASGISKIEKTEDQELKSSGSSEVSKPTKNSRKTKNSTEPKTTDKKPRKTKNSEDTEGPKPAVKRTRKRKQEDQEQEPPIKSPKISSMPATTLKEKVMRLPNPNAPIPQREKDKKEQEEIKQKAIELFKLSKNKDNNGKKKR